MINMTKGDYIPDDIIAEILSKLPSKSVLRFVIASKRWYSLISDPVFINLHSKQTSQSPKILYKPEHPKSTFQLLDYESSLFDDCCLSDPIKFSGKSYNHPKIVGSSCGLVCVATNDRSGVNNFTIWNPLTKEYKKIPNLSTMKNSYYEPYFHGLGYDPVANDIKLVISRDTIKFNIFSLKANSWKKITCPFASEYYNPDAIEHWNSLAIVLNGIFHWIVVPRTSNDSEIVAFDVGNKRFQKLHMPRSLGRLPCLLEHIGRLCVSFIKPPGTEIWMMKEYDTWVHFLTIKSSSGFEYFGLPVLYISTKSKVVFPTDEKFSKCGKEEENKLDEKFRILPFFYGTVLYVETLISPNAKNRLQRTGCKYRKRKRSTN